VEKIGISPTTSVLHCEIVVFNYTTFFEAIPRRCPHESAESVVGRKGFRVCINDDNCQRFRDPYIWPDSISISEWFSKGQNRNEKRRRVHDSSVNSSRAIQSTNCDNQASALSSYADNRAATAATTAIAKPAATGSTSRQAHVGDAMSEDDTILADLTLQQ